MNKKTIINAFRILITFGIGVSLIISYVKNDIRALIVLAMLYILLVLRKDEI